MNSTKHTFNTTVIQPCSTWTLLQVSLPHNSQTGLVAVWRRLWPQPTVSCSVTAALPLLLQVTPWVSQRDDHLLPARLHLPLRLLFGGRNVAVNPRINRGVWDGGGSVKVLVWEFDVTGAAAAVRVEFCPDAAVHHTDQVCGLHRETENITSAVCQKKNGAEHEVTWRLEANKLSLSGSPYLSLAEAGGAGGSQSVPRWPLQKSRRGHVPVGSGNSALWPHNVPGVLNHWVDVLWGAAGTIRPRNKHFFIVWVQSWPWRRRKY